MGRTAAFFDLDKTVIAKSSVLALGRAFYQGGLITRRMVTQSAFAQFRYVLRGTSSGQMEEVKNRLAALSKGWSVDQVNEIIAGSIQDRIAPIVYAEAAALIEQHRSAGRDVVIVSSAGAEVVRPIAAMLGVDQVVATELAIADGFYTGEVLSFPAGAAKVEAMLRIAEAAGYRLDDCYAYSDSITDVPMLAAVGHPTAVNPDKELRAVAAENGWPVLDFVRPGKSRSGKPRSVRRQVALGGAAVAVGLLLGWLWFGRDNDSDA